MNKIQDKDEKNKRRKRAILSALPALGMMTVIFIFSSKNAEQSNATSSPFAETALKAYEGLFGNDSLQQNSFSFIHHLVRKAAHMTEYGILAILIAFHLKVCKVSGWKLFGISSVASITYAATDEFHQLFVPGRSGQLSDVMIDGAGAVLGVAFFYLATQIYSARHHKHNQFGSISE